MRLAAVLFGLSLALMPAAALAASSLASGIHTEIRTNTQEAQPGDTVEYTIIVTNTTDMPITNIDVEDGCEDGDVTVVDVGDGGTVDSDGTIRWHIDELAPHASRALHYRVTIGPNDRHPTIRNSITVWQDSHSVLSTATNTLAVLQEMPQTGVDNASAQSAATDVAPVQSMTSTMSPLMISAIVILVGGAVAGAYGLGRKMGAGLGDSSFYTASYASQVEQTHRVSEQ